MTINRGKITTRAAALRAQAIAQRKRAYADRLASHDPTGARFERLEADDMDAVAAIALDPAGSLHSPLETGRGGELIVDSPAIRSEKQWLLDTVRDSPDMVAADASVARLDLAADAGVLTLAVDSAESIQVSNSLRSQ